VFAKEKEIELFPSFSLSNFLVAITAVTGSSFNGTLGKRRLLLLSLSL